MLTEDTYNTALNVNEKLKYNINPNLDGLFNIVLFGFAKRLLNHEFSSELNEKQINYLQQLINSF